MTPTQVLMTDGWHDVSDGTLTVGGVPVDHMERWSDGVVRFHEPSSDGSDTDGSWVTARSVVVLAIRTGAAGGDDADRVA